MDDKLGKIYKYLSSQNVANLPATQDDFNTMMQDDSKAQKVHQYLLSQNVANVDDDFNTFKDNIGLKKKVSPIDLASKGQTVLSDIVPGSEKPLEQVGTTPSTPVEPTPTPEEINQKFQDFLSNSVEPKNPFIQAASSTNVAMDKGTTLPQAPRTPERIAAEKDVIKQMIDNIY